MLILCCADLHWGDACVYIGRPVYYFFFGVRQKQFRLWRRTDIAMWLLTRKSDEWKTWPHGIYDNLEALETELRRLDSQGFECTVFHMPEVDAVNTLGPIDMFEGSFNDVDRFMRYLR